MTIDKLRDEIEIRRNSSPKIGYEEGYQDALDAVLDLIDGTYLSTGAWQT